MHVASTGQLIHQADSSEAPPSSSVWLGRLAV